MSLKNVEPINFQFQFINKEMFCTFLKLPTHPIRHFGALYWLFEYIEQRAFWIICMTFN